MTWLHPKSQPRLGSISQTSDLPTRHSIHHQELTSILEQSCTNQSCWMPDSRKTTTSLTVFPFSVGLLLEVRLQCQFNRSQHASAQRSWFLKIPWRNFGKKKSFHVVDISKNKNKSVKNTSKNRQNLIKTDTSFWNCPSKKTPHLSAIPSNKRNATSTHFSHDLSEMKVFTSDTQPSSKSSRIWDIWRRSQSPKSPSNPAKASTCLTTASWGIKHHKKTLCSFRHFGENNFRSVTQRESDARSRSPKGSFWHLDQILIPIPQSALSADIV